MITVMLVASPGATSSPCPSEPGRLPAKASETLWEMRSSSFTDWSTPASDFFPNHLKLLHLRFFHICVALCCQLKRQLFGTTLSSLHLSVELAAGGKHYMTPGWSWSAPPLRWPNTPPGSNNNCFSSGKFSSQVHCCFLSSSLTASLKTVQTDSLQELKR